MKKIILSLAAVLAFSAANAQDKKESKGFGFSEGNVIVEGNLSFGSSTTDNGGAEVKENNLNFSPKVGYFLSDKLALGVELGVGSAKEETGANETTSNTFNAGVFARYYFLDLGQRFKTYTEAGLGFGSGKNEVNGNETSSNSSLNFGIDLGINYFVTENFAINFGLNNVLGYSNTTTEFPGGGETKVSSFNGNLNVFNNFFDTPSFGLTWKF